MRMRGYRIYTTKGKMAVTRNDPVPSVDFKCAMAIYAKLRSITAVVLNNSFITLAMRRTGKTTGASD